MSRPLLLSIALAIAAPAVAQGAQDAATLDEVRAIKTRLDAQAAEIAVQRARVQALEDRLLGGMRGTAAPGRPLAVTSPDAAASAPVQVAQAAPSAPPPAPGVTAPVGQAPSEPDRGPEVAVLSEQGGIITRRGQITVEPSLEYARADRNRVVFRGIAILPAFLTGVFDINENRQDILTASLGLRFGVSSRLEINARAPFVYRADQSILAPIATPGAPGSSSRDASTNAANLGDVDFGARYQLTDGGGGLPFLIAGIQTVAPTGTSPFKVRRDPGTFVALESATGGGFWSVTPTLTALLPSDPAVLFGTFGYTRNFGRSFDSVRINSDLAIDYVKPGDALQASLGIGVSLNPRAAISLGYAHNWAFGTRTVGSVSATDSSGRTTVTPFETTLRDLQIGRFLFGVSYRTSRSTTINWNVEVGATSDAADVRTTLRVPISFGGR